MAGMRFVFVPLLLLKLVAAGSGGDSGAPGTVTVDKWYTKTETMEKWSTKNEEHWYTTSNWYTTSKTSTTTTTTTTTTTKPTTTTTTTTTTKPTTTTTTTTTTKPTTTTTTSISTSIRTNSTTTTTTTTTTRSTTTTTTSATTIFITVPSLATCPSVTRTVPTTVTTTIISVTTSIVVQSGTGTTSIITQQGTGTTVTQPGATVIQSGTAITITSTRLITSVQSPVISTVTSLASSSCQFCKVDIYATELIYPYNVRTTTIYSTTTGLYPTQYANGSRTTRTSVTVITPDPCLTRAPPTTWIFSGVELTSPTHYIYHTRADHQYLFPSPVYGGCGITTVPLSFAATDAAALIYGTMTTPVPTSGVAASGLVAYLNAMPTVQAQLSGVPLSFCDDPSTIVASATQPVDTLLKVVVDPGSITVVQGGNGALG